MSFYKSYCKIMLREFHRIIFESRPTSATIIFCVLSSLTQKYLKKEEEEEEEDERERERERRVKSVMTNVSE